MLYFDCGRAKYFAGAAGSACRHETRRDHSLTAGSHAGTPSAKVNVIASYATLTGRKAAIGGPFRLPEIITYEKAKVDN
jgi:hypothetical protein